MPFTRILNAIQYGSHYTPAQKVSVKGVVPCRFLAITDFADFHRLVLKIIIINNSVLICGEPPVKLNKKYGIKCQIMAGTDKIGWRPKIPIRCARLRLRQGIARQRW